jgi:putative ABC transport system permease protein
MGMTRAWWSKIRAVVSGRQGLSRELSEELGAHLELEVQELIARGMPPDEARETARRRFGNVTLIHEDANEAWAFSLFENCVKDVAYACRMLRKNPGFAVAAILTLALGIGGNTAMFTVIRGVLLKPLEYREPEQLARISVDVPQQHLQDVGFTLQRFDAIRSRAHSFTELAAFFIATENMTLSGAGEPQALNGARVSHDFLQVLGVEPALGRSFLADEDQPGGRPVAMISAQLWKSRFSGDPQVIGKTATLNSVPHTIIGVLPPGFQFPSPGVDVWVTKPAEFSAIAPQGWPTAPILIGLGRLKPRVTLEQARAELDVLGRQYSSSHPSDADSIMRTTLLSSHMVEKVRTMLWILFGAVGLVLLAACANVASLLLARAAARSSEFAVRAALGAARGRLIRQLLAESLLLALAGGVAGLLLAKWGVNAITGFGALNLPRASEIRIDATVLGFSAALSIATGVLFGMFPSMQASRPDVADALRAHGEGRGAERLVALGMSPRGLLVVAQVALSIMLLIGAALLMRTLLHLYSVGPGFQPESLLTMQIALPPARYDTGEKLLTFYNELVQRLETVPGVRGASVALTLPAGVKWGVPIQAVGQPAVPAHQRMQVELQSVTPGYFATMKIPLRRGREFTARDNVLNAPQVAMINESLARRLWPAYRSGEDPGGQDPVGQHLRLGPDQTSGGVDIIGIAADVRESGLAQDAQSELYLPTSFFRPQRAGLVIRTNGDPKSFVNAVRSQVLSIDRDQPVTAVKTMDEVLETSVGQQRLTLLLLGAFAGVAVLLAVVGLWGVISYSVAQRTREVGIRRALGAQQSDILRLIVGQGIGLTLAGVAIGIGGAFGLTRVMKGLLFGVTATDPATFVEVAGLFLLVALAASYLPARQAARIDPMTALR